MTSSDPPPDPGSADAADDETRDDAPAGPSRFHALDVSPAARSGPVASLTMTAEFAHAAGRRGARGGDGDASTPHDNHLKRVRWSPDGVCLLTCGAEDNTFRVYDVHPDACERAVATNRRDATTNATTSASGDGVVPHHDALWPALRIKEHESVHDYAWYPRMTATDQATCVFASTSRATPIHLWDAVTGSLRASYIAYDHLDEPVAACAVAFSGDGARIFAGYDKRVRVWDASRPGRDCDEWKTNDGRRRGSGGSGGGQTGLLSCLATSPLGSPHALLAAGSYDKTVGIYHEATGERIAVLSGHAGGVTHARWSPCGCYLYTAARRDDAMLCWDVRGGSGGGSGGGAVYRMRRRARMTNQRIGFDVEPCGRHLVSGGEDGVLRAYDLTTGEEAGAWRGASDVVSDWAFHPGASFAAPAPAGGNGVVGGVPRGASVSGCRHFRSRADSESESESDADADADEEGKAAAAADEGPTNALRVWDYSTVVVPVA